MKDWIKFCNESTRVVRVIMAALYVPTLLVRIFTCVLNKWNHSGYILTFVLQLIPIIGQVIYIIDIVYAVMGKPFMLSIFDLNKDDNKKSENEKMDKDKVVDVESNQK